MRITDMLVIADIPSRFESEKDTPYVLLVYPDNRVGDKLNFGPSPTGTQWPIRASDRFETIEEAWPIYWKFLAYVQGFVERNKKEQIKIDNGKERVSGPSGNLWS